MRQRTGAGRRNLRSASYDAAKVVAKFSAPPKPLSNKTKGKSKPRTKVKTAARASR